MCTVQRWTGTRSHGAASAASRPGGAEGFARLCQMSRPAAILPSRWSELVDNAGVFIDRWAVQAASLGWNAADIFGCHREAPLASIPSW